jgi:predicted SAM-dependent methyltransferase
MKINLASGQRPFPKPWINIDLIPQTDSDGKPYDLDFVTNANDLHMFEDESIDILVAHHLVEHIAIHDLDVFITEWRRVLKKGGILAIFVPNLREINRAWLDGRISTFIHNVNTYGAYQGHVEDLHKWGYDERELQDRVSGWDGAKNKYEWSKVQMVNVSNPLYSGANLAHDWWILEMEFHK